MVALLCWGNLAARETATASCDRRGRAGPAVVWAGALQVMLDTGKNADWFEIHPDHSYWLWCRCGFGAFLLWELTEEHPIVDLIAVPRPQFHPGDYGVLPGQRGVPCQYCC